MFPDDLISAFVCTADVGARMSPNSLDSVGFLLRRRRRRLSMAFL